MKSENELEKVINNYMKQFGGFPSYLLLGAKEEEVIKLVKEALRIGKELEAFDKNADY